MFGPNRENSRVSCSFPQPFSVFPPPRLPFRASEAFRRVMGIQAAATANHLPHRIKIESAITPPVVHDVEVDLALIPWTGNSAKRECSPELLIDIDLNLLAISNEQ